MGERPMVPPQEPRETMAVTPAERELLELIRRIRYGSIGNLKIENGRPVVADELLEKIRFTR